MKRSEKESINQVNDRVVRRTSEPEDIDLAAEATAGAPAKETQPRNRKSGKFDLPRRRRAAP